MISDTVKLLAEIENLKRRIAILERGGGRLLDSASGGINALGTKVLNKVIAARAYDENGDLIAAGDEATPVASLLETWDWLRVS